MEKIYRIVKTVEKYELDGKVLRCRDFEEQWWSTIDECFEKDYVTRRDDCLKLTKNGADFIGLYEELLKLLPRQFFLTL